MPTAGTYNYSQIQRDLNTKIHGRRTNLISGDTGDTNIERDLINSAVRQVISDVDIRGNIREVLLTPNLMDNQYDYALPTDVKGSRIIDLRPQVTDSRGLFETYDIIPRAEFDRRKQYEKGIATVVDDDLTRYIRVSADVEDETLVIDEMEDTGWNTFGNSVNDSDVKVDGDDYTQGAGAIRFQTDTTDTADSTVGIQKAVTAFDISPYKANGSVFVDGKITTYDTGIHSLTVRLGSDSDNYYEITDSNQNDCSAFVSGWNRIRLDMVNKTTTGSPTDTAIDYAAIFWNRDTTTAALLHLNDTDWHFDNFIAKNGKYYLLSYYTRNVWQDTAFSLSENSSHDSHALLVQNDEYEMILAKIAENASAYLRDREDQGYYRDEYEKLKGAYLLRNPSEAGVVTTTYHDFESTEGTPLASNDS